VGRELEDAQKIIKRVLAKRPQAITSDAVSGSK
jgi:hypothetical protein